MTSRTRFADYDNRYEGQAGGSAITLKNNTAMAETALMQKLYPSLRKDGVPTYAVPPLVRLVDEIATGDNYKQAKNELAKKSWSPKVGQGTDRLYWLDGTTYRSLDTQSWEQIEHGVPKLSTNRLL